MKGNSHRGYQAEIADLLEKKKRAPARGHWGSNGAQAGLITAGSGGGNVDQTARAPRISFSRAWWRAQCA
jgi:hypothetical protein